MLSNYLTLRRGTESGGGGGLSETRCREKERKENGRCEKERTSRGRKREKRGEGRGIKRKRPSSLCIRDAPRNKLENYSGCVACYRAAGRLAHRSRWLRSTCPEELKRRRFFGLSRATKDNAAYRAPKGGEKFSVYAHGRHCSPLRRLASLLSARACSRATGFIASKRYASR